MSTGGQLTSFSPTGATIRTACWPSFGATVRRPSDRRLCLTWVGPQTDGTEWVNTTVHEIVHVAIAVSADAGIDPYTETFAYLVGDITEQVSDLICLLSCDHCREGKND